jgi:hypothetical protein
MEFFRFVLLRVGCVGGCSRTDPSAYGLREVSSQTLACKIGLALDLPSLSIQCRVVNGWWGQAYVRQVRLGCVEQSARRKAQAGSAKARVREYTGPDADPFGVSLSQWEAGAPPASQHVGLPYYIRSQACLANKFV